ncbi:MAG: DUF2752 domain-containing protein [Bacteroidota bacterium]
MAVRTIQRFSKPLLWLRLVAYVLIPLVLLILPSDFFDSGEPKCLSILLAGTECYGCGMTRGIMHLIHFEFADAYYYHPLSFVVFPLLAFLWARWFLRDLRQLKQAS